MTNWGKENRDKTRAASQRYRERHPRRFRALQRRWRGKNRKRLSAMAKARRKRNPEKANAYKRRWYRANLKKARSYSLKWRMANIEKARNFSREWNRKNREKILAANRKVRAKRMMVTGHHSLADIRKLFFKQNGRCIGCGKNIFNASHIDHKTPLSRGGSDYPRNLQLLCASCNHSKNNKTMREWRAYKNKLAKIQPPKRKTQCR